jgi:hypothetical protein
MRFDRQMSMDRTASELHDGSTASCGPCSDQVVMVTQSERGLPTEQLGQCYTQQQPLLLQFYAGRA